MECNRRGRQIAGTVVVVLFWCAPLSAASYWVTFDATWSSTSHPQAYPQSAHFSTPYGTTHNADVQFWAPGTLATPGIELVAETGSVRVLRQEIDARIQSGDAFGYALGLTFLSPSVNRFGLEVVEQYPLVSLVSMIAPSPDWFVGVHDLSLRDEQGWLDRLVVPLYPYDAGTESGNEFSVSNPASAPEPIRRLDTDPSSILYEAQPLGTLTFERLVACDFNRDDGCDASDLSSDSGLYSVGDLTVGIPVVLGKNSRFDLNQDQRVDEGDLDHWLAVAAEQNGFVEPYLRGDTNLNDHVGFGDFLRLSSSFGVGVEWTDGNYDGSPFTDFGDFLALSSNYGKRIRRQDQAIVPEALATVELWWWGTCLYVFRRRNFRCRKGEMS